MQGERVSFFVKEGQHHSGQLLYQWLLQQGRSHGFSGGTALHSLAGFGRHGWHEAHFFELAGELPVVTVFVGTATQVEQLLRDVSEAGLSVFYTREVVRFGITGTS